MALTWLDIPLELRLITYRLFFECRSSYPITGIQDKRVECFMDDVYTPDTNQTSHLLNIMLACKQVHAEIKALLHQEATLLVEYSSLCSAREASSLRDLNTFGNLLFTSIYPRRFASFERALCRQLDGRRALQTLRLEVHKYVSGPLNKANLDTILRLGKVSSHKLQFSMAPAAFMTDHEIFRGPIPRICEVTVDRNGGVTIRGLIRMYTDDVKDQLMAADGVLEGTKIMVMTSYPKSRSSKTFVKAESVASGG